MEDIMEGKLWVDILIRKPWRISWKVNYEWIFWYVNHSWYHFSSHLIYRLSQDAKSIHGSSYFSIYNLQIVIKVSHPPLPLKLVRPESKPNKILTKPNPNQTKFFREADITGVVKGDDGWIMKVNYWNYYVFLVCQFLSGFLWL